MSNSPPPSKSTTSHHIKQLFIPLLLLILAFFSFFLSPSIAKIITGSKLHGYESHPDIHFPRFIDSPFSAPALILASFSGCEDICPSNYQLIKELNEAYPAELNLYVVNIGDEVDKETYLAWLSEYTGLDVQELSGFDLVQENIQQLANGVINHAGYLYSYFPQDNSLLTYTNPTAEKILHDLNIKAE